MLSDQQHQTLNLLLAELSPQQIAWLSGYAAGKITASTAAASKTTTCQIAIVYGSQSGNAKGIATALAKTLGDLSAQLRVECMSAFKLNRLAKTGYLFIAVSTHGEGEPPDTAKAFYDFLHSARAPDLSHLRYGIIALGDSSYEYFCKTGHDIDVRLGQLGAQAVMQTVACDVDFAQDSEKWQRNVCTYMHQTLQTASAHGHAVITAIDNAAAITAPPLYTRHNPFTATVVEHVTLTSAPRRTTHLELSLADSAMTYQPGDSLGVWPQNNAALAQKIASLLGLNWQQTVTLHDMTASVEEWLIHKLDIARLTPLVLSRYAEIAAHSTLTALMADKQACKTYLRGRTFADVLTDFPTNQPDAALGCLRQLAPRLYSLASSQTLRGDEAHILVGETPFQNYAGQTRYGLCSTYLINQQTGGNVAVFLQPNESFRLPADTHTPIIMIGAGTGVAPFRAFLEEREETGGGKTWLFFGERTRREDFYYQTELLSYLKSGVLSRLDVAFSRDRAHKVYVQDRLREQRKTVWEWLQQGATVYVCGDEKKLAAGVDAELVAMAETFTSDGAAYINHLKEEQRYLRDVY